MRGAERVNGIFNVKAVLSIAMAVAFVAAAFADVELPPASTLIAQERYEEAIVQLDRALAADPSDKDAALARARCLFKLDRFREAAAAAAKLAGEVPERLDVRDFYGDCQMMNFDADAAISTWAPLLEDRRWFPVVLRKSVLAMLAVGRDSDVMELLARRVKIGADTPEEQLLLLLKAYGHGKTRLDALSELLRRSPGNRAYQEEHRLSVMFAERGPGRVTPPRVFPMRAKIREIWNEPSIEVLLEGKKSAWIAFDTGSQRPLLNRDMCRKMGLEPVAWTIKEGWGYREAKASPTIVLKSLKVGSIEVSDLPAQVNERDSEFWSRKAGYLGLQPFMPFVLLYDRRGGKLEVWPKGTPAAGLLGDEKGTTLPVLWSSGLPLVQVAINGRGGYPFLLDTGAPYTILDKAAAARSGIRPNTGKYRNLHGVGVTGAFSYSVAEGVVLSFAGLDSTAPFAYLSDVPQRFFIPCYGILGRDFLNRFKIVFDGPGGEVTLVPYP